MINQLSDNCSKEGGEKIRLYLFYGINSRIDNVSNE